MPPNPFAEGLSVQVSGDASGATSALDNLQGGLASTRKMALGLGGVLAGALAVKGFGSAVEAASSYEDALVEVQKVTDAQTADALGESMRELSTEIPVAAEELAGLAADAARFGVRGTENIERFTESVAKMATATDLSTEQAGEAFARLAQLTDTPVDKMENLGSSINELSNNMATSAGEIVDSMLRSSAALSQFGLNNTEIVGMSAALNEVSESSERAGSRLRRLAQELMDPRKVGDLATALGMTEEEFRNIRRERPDELMMMIVEAMAEGDDTAEALRGTLSTTSRQAVAGLAQNLDGLRQALKQANTSFDEGTSLQKEFDAATNTFNSRLQVLKNNLNDIAIEVGNNLLPELNPFLETVNDLLSGSRDLSDVLGEDTANNLSNIGTAFGNLEEPVKANADEIFRLATNLWGMSEEVLPSVTPALVNLRVILEGTAAALDTINDALEMASELWDKLPPEVREGAVRGAINAVASPIGGRTQLQTGLNTARVAMARERRGPPPQEFGVETSQQQELVIRVEGNDPLSQLIREEVNFRSNRRNRRVDRSRSRGTVP